MTIQNLLTLVPAYKLSRPNEAAAVMKRELITGYVCIASGLFLIAAAVTSLMR